MSKVLTIILFLLVYVSSSQMNKFVYSVNKKSVHFKDLYDSIQADYSSNKQYVKINDTNTINLDSNSCIFYQGFKNNIHLKAKMDLHNKGNDTIIFIYSFFDNRLFEFDIYTNNDSVARIYHRLLMDDFKKRKRIPYVYKKLTGNGGRGKNKDYNYLFIYDFKEKRYKIRLVYDKVNKYIPFWCGTGKPADYPEGMIKILNSK